MKVENITALPAFTGISTELWGTYRKQREHLSYNETKAYKQKQLMSVKSKHLLLVLVLSRRVNLIKSSRAISRV